MFVFCYSSWESVFKLSTVTLSVGVLSRRLISIFMT